MRADRELNAAREKQLVCTLSSSLFRGESLPNVDRDLHFTSPRTVL